MENSFMDLSILAYMLLNSLGLGNPYVHEKLIYEDYLK